MTAAQHLLWLYRHGIGWHFSASREGWQLVLTWPRHGQIIITEDLERNLRRVCGLVALSSLA